MVHRRARQPAARLALRASDGSYPGDRLALSAKAWPNLEAHAVFIRGEQAFDLPAGKASITAARGPQYATAAAEVDVVPGKDAAVELRLKRLYPGTVVKAGAHQVLVPRPKTAKVGGKPLVGRELLGWTGEFLATVLGS